MEDTQKNQKTVVAFIAGLLIGGLLVWVFSIAPEERKNGELKMEGDFSEVEGADEEKGGDVESPVNKQAEMKTPVIAAVQGAGSVVVDDQTSGAVVKLGAVTFPVDAGWVVVHETNADGSLGNALGASRFGLKDGLVPTQIELLRATSAGKTYKVVFYSENGDKVFDKKDDARITAEGGAAIEDAFTAK